MFDTSKKFNAHIEGRGELHVTPVDHVASGGEGHVYRPGAASLALKIWDDPNRATAGRMAEKIKALSVLTHPGIVAPEALVRDRKGNLIGYVMPWVSGWDLPVAFTNDWQVTENFGITQALAFVDSMRAIVLFTHGHNVIMGDANEMNILGVANLPRYIDVDPWLPRGFTGDKIMPTIQDRHAPLFTREADWFAWAIVTFQLLTGIHPYKGTHPDFKRSDLAGRMTANASVFDPRVKLNAAVRPVSLIPSTLRRWYEAVFQSGERSIPPPITPTSVTGVISVRFIDRTPSDRLTVTEVFHLPAPFARLVAGDTLLLADGQLMTLPDGRDAGHIDAADAFHRAPGGGLFGAAVELGEVWYGRITPGVHGDLLPSGIAATAVWAASGRVFAVVRDGLLELMFGENLILTGQRWSLNPNGTVFGDGAAIYDGLGSKFLVVPQTATRAIVVIRVRELDGQKPVSIVARDRTVIVSTIDNVGEYRRSTIRLDADLLSYHIATAAADDGSLSDVILPNGLVLWIDSKGDLGMSPGGTFALGPCVGGKLISTPVGVFCIAGNTVYRVSMTA